uniref:Uncharacterized protein n=1 Tax=Anguilla anguilla TaxID=7936 RepID=A0A0E9PFB8_ANGAN
MLKALIEIQIPHTQLWKKKVLPSTIYGLDVRHQKEELECMKQSEYFCENNKYREMF